MKTSKQYTENEIMQGIKENERGTGYENDPYAFFSLDKSGSVRMGQAKDNNSDGHIDNITNHIVEAP